MKFFFGLIALLFVAFANARPQLGQGFGSRQNDLPALVDAGIAAGIGATIGGVVAGPIGFGIGAVGGAAAGADFGRNTGVGRK